MPERWAPEHASTLAQSTRERYATVYSVHIAPWLDDFPVRDLTVARLRAWQTERIRSGVSPGTVGTPAEAASARASILDPMRAMTAAGGPTKVIPACVHASAKPAFSDRKP